jgi:hypothetical protein
MICRIGRQNRNSTNLLGIILVKNWMPWGSSQRNSINNTDLLLSTVVEQYEVEQTLVQYSVMALVK